MLAGNLNSNTNANNISNTSNNTKKILELSCYIKIERNGIEVKFKNAVTHSPSKIIIYEIYSVNSQNKAVNTTKKDNKNITHSYQIHLKNINNEEFFSFDIKNINAVIDRLIDEGKLTLVISIMNEKTIIFMFKTSKLILENFVQQIKKLRIEEEKIINVDQLNNNKQNNNSKIVSNPNNLTINLEANKKRKIKDLYNQASKFDSNNLQIKKFKKNTETTKSMQLFTKINFLDLPFEIKSFVYDYLDKINLTKISLLCKESKSNYDESMERLKFRNDTPSNNFYILMKRFQKIKILNMGKGKFIKNEVFKHFDVSLRNLEELDLSQITILNDASIRKFLSKTKSINIKTLKLNFYLDSLSSCLFYILEFFINLYELDITCDFKISKLDLYLKSLEKEPRCFHPNIFNTICELIMTKKYLRKLNLHLFNTINLNSLSKFNLLSNLEFLSIDLLIIGKLKDLSFLTSASNLKGFAVKEILLGKKTDSFKLTQCDFAAMPENEINMKTNASESENPEDHLGNLNLDYSNDYIEFFSNIFFKLKKLIQINFGSFVNKDLLKIISLYCKGVEELSLNSNKITDDCVHNAISTMTNLKFLDLRGSESIQGSCFLDINPWPENFKRVKLSISNYNFCNLIEYLRSRGVDAENYSI